MKTLAFVIGLCIMAVGSIGLVAPSALVWLAQRFVAPVDRYWYAIAMVRVAFGLLLLSVANTSRMPRALRVVAIIPIVAGLAIPLVGVERARATIAWWLAQGSDLVRFSGIPLLGLGGFVAYACSPGAAHYLIRLCSRLTGRARG